MGSHDGKDVADIIIGITDDELLAQKMYEIVGNMRFGDIFSEDPRFKISCLPDGEI